MTEYLEAIDKARAKFDGHLNIQALDSRFTYLLGKGGNITSQNGEDGILCALFERIGVKNRWCFEVGAADGIHISNTWSLRESGWNSVLIDSHDEGFEKLKRRFGHCAFCVHKRIDRDDLDKILWASGAPADLDFGVIDVDGQEWHLWDGLKKFRPRVMLVEYMTGVPHPVPEIGGEGQADKNEIRALGESKGYLAVADLTINLLFVDKGALP